jgi:ATP-dependent Lon protease
LKEKLLAARRAGTTTVLIPQENEKDLSEVPQHVKKGLEIIPVKSIEEILSHALVRMPSPEDQQNAGDSDKDLSALSPTTAENQDKGVIRH